MFNILYIVAIIYNDKELSKEDLYVFNNKTKLNNFVNKYKMLEENGECKIIISNKIINHPEYE